MPWLLNEDAAIKEKFKGLVVTDANAPPEGRPVAVRFLLPGYELATMDYPTIVITHGGVSKADDREHRGPAHLPYIPEDQDPNVLSADGQPYIASGATSVYPDRSPLRTREQPIPYNVDYQVVAYHRLQQHQTQLTAALGLIERIPARFGYLEIPQDGTIRSLDLIGGPERVAEKDSDGKRVFRTHYSVRVYSELSLYEVRSLTGVFNPVESVNLNVHRLDDVYDV